MFYRRVTEGLFCVALAQWFVRRRSPRKQDSQEVTCIFSIDIRRDCIYIHMLHMMYNLCIQLYIGKKVNRLELFCFIKKTGFITNIYTYIFM